MQMSKKQEVITEIFNICQKTNNYEFDNDLVKTISKKIGFGNPFDATKLDNTRIFPEILVEKDYFIIHLGSGKHKTC